MMNEHIPIDELSAYLDGESAPAEHEVIERHLGSCAQCSGDHARLQHAAALVAALPQVKPTPDESRAIRIRVLEEMERTRRPARRVWAAAGAVALLGAGVFGFLALSRGPREAGPPAAMKESLDEGPLIFDSEREVTQIVASHPQVRAGLDRYRVGDVGTRQQEALEAFGPSEMAAMPADTSSQAPEAGEARTSAATAAERTIGDCLRTILRGQPFPLMPILARPAVFKGTPGYLLVYAWTRSADNENARLNLTQVWVVDRVSCTVLHFQQFDPKDVP